MCFLLVTVTDPSPASRAHLDGLLRSLATQAEPCDLALVVRGGGPLKLPATSPGVVIHQITVPRKTSLSHARNLALEYARGHGLLAGRAVAFPDDDCAYPSGALRRAAEHLRSGTDLALGVYGPAPELVDRRRFPSAAVTVDADLVMSSASSATMFLTAALVAAVGDFDERLGLGARFGSAEDADYMIRALAGGAAARYDPHLVVLHPYKTERPEQYFAGTVAVLAKHALGGGRTFSLLLHRLAVGLFLLSRRQLRPRGYASALRAAGLMLPAGGELPNWTR